MDSDAGMVVTSMIQTCPKSASGLYSQLPRSQTFRALARSFNLLRVSKSGQIIGPNTLSTLMAHDYTLSLPSAAPVDPALRSHLDDQAVISIPQIVK
ncbi:hypothetical protein P692DRAFT_20186022 [Suillus brevipes Sb2]|nr:hypothetical protein P692DRAFT_20186022 [Suillus brevipes Sb2]